MKSKNKLVILNGKGTQVSEKKNFITTILNSYSTVEVINIGNTTDGFKFSELDNLIKDIGDEDYYTLVVNSHGNAFLNEDPLDTKHLKKHYLSLESGHPAIETGELFLKLKEIFINKPLNILMISCKGKYAQDYIELLPQGSTLVTFSGDNTTSSTDFTLPTEGSLLPNTRLKNSYSFSLSDTIAQSGLGPHTLLSHLVEIYCLNQRVNAFDPKIGIHTKNGNLLHFKIGQFAKEQAENFKEFSPMFTQLFLNQSVDENYTKSLITNIKNDHLTIKNLAPKFPLVETFKNIDACGVEGFIELIEKSYYPSKSFKSADFEETLQFKKNIYDRFAKDYKDKSLVEIKEGIIREISSYIPKTAKIDEGLESIGDFAESEIAVELWRKSHKEELAKNNNIPFNSLLSSTKNINCTENVKANETLNMLLIKFYQFIRYENELALFKAMVNFTAEFTHLYPNAIPALDKSSANSSYADLISRITNKLLITVGNDYNAVILVPKGDGNFQWINILDKVLLTDDYMDSVFRYPRENTIFISDKEVRDELKCRFTEYKDLSNSHRFEAKLKDCNSLYDTSDKSHKISAHNISLALATEYFFNDKILDIINEAPIIGDNLFH